MHVFSHHCGGVAENHAEQHVLLQVIGAPTLFATHFHELTAITGTVGVKNSHMQTNLDLQSNKLTMLYNVVDGVCDQSFGIHVAEFAGFPQDVIDNAKDRLAKLEAGGMQSKHLQVRCTLSLDLSCAAVADAACPGLPATEYHLHPGWG